MELAPSGPQRSSNIRLNEILVAKANGLLAEITGSEKYLTVGCGHTAAFCKLAKQGGKTPEPTMADGNWMIDHNKLATDNVLLSMIEEGWDWEIIPSYIDFMFPTFAHCAKNALNAKTCCLPCLRTGDSHHPCQHLSGHRYDDKCK